MVSLPEHVDRFRASRKDAREVLATRMVLDAQKVKRLDAQVGEFLVQLKLDASNHDADSLSKHLSAFESEVHEELEALFASARDDLLLFEKTLQTLSACREYVGSLPGGVSLRPLGDSELGFASVLTADALRKLETLSLLARKLRKS